MLFWNRSTKSSSYFGPEAGRLRPELRAGLRSFPVGRYLIFYTVNSSDIEIARVIHSARDIEGLLG